MLTTILANLDAGLEAVGPVTVEQLGASDLMVYGAFAFILVVISNTTPKILKIPIGTSWFKVRDMHRRLFILASD